MAVLRAFNIIDEEQRTHFDRVRVLRRRYLHFFSQSHDSIESDALEVFKSSVVLVTRLMGTTIQEGRVGLRPALMRYIAAHTGNPPSA